MFNNALRGVNVAQSILRLPAVKARTGLSRSTIYLRMSTGQFPRAINLGLRAVGWAEADIENWIARHIERSRSVQPADRLKPN